MSKNIIDEEDKIDVNYYHDFLDKQTADDYFQLFENQVEYNSDEDSKIIIFGKSMQIPRKQVAFGEAGTYYMFSGSKVDAKDWSEDTELTKALLEIKALVENKTGKEFNFVLINRYEDGNQYIGYHSDDEKQLGDEPIIAGVTFGAERDFIFKSNKLTKNIDDKQDLVLHHGSLVVMNHPTNKYWKHSLPKRTKVTTPRINLTFRYMHY
jgi:alpha-ketoglutarate-dependent dioxygenase alkB family protein 2